jgi:hypothetical protein
MARGGPPAWGLGVRLRTLHCKKNKLVTNVVEGLRLGWIHGINDLS